jgi:GT2 family glycosyltransferase
MKVSQIPLVSILIPAYNCAPWIEQTLRSAVSQTWPRTEVIIVDDGSIDDTASVCRSFESAKVRIICGQNKGASAARNHAFKQCQGDFIQWLDSDDILAVDKIERQLRRAETDGDALTLWSGPWARFFYRISRARYEPTPLWNDLSARDWIVEHVGNSHWMPPAVWLVSRALTERAGLWDESLSLDDDGEYACRLVSLSSKVGFVADARCYYRMANSASLSHSRTRSALESLYRAALLKRAHALGRDDSPQMREACGKGLSWVANFLEGGAPDLALQAKMQLQEWGGTTIATKVTAKYTIARAVLGARRAGQLKTYLWRVRCSVARHLDKLICTFFGTGALPDYLDLHRETRNGNRRRPG